MTDKKPVMTRPYVALDGRFGDFEGRFETWYLLQDSRSTRMKEMLSVAFGIFEADPMLYSMISGHARNEPLSVETLTKLLKAAAIIRKASPTQAPKAKKPKVVFREDNDDTPEAEEKVSSTVQRSSLTNNLDD